MQTSLDASARRLPRQAGQAKRPATGSSNTKEKGFDSAGIGAYWTEASGGVMAAGVDA